MTHINIDLAKLLVELEMTQTAFAKAIGYSRAQLNKACRTSRCSANMIRAIRQFIAQYNINLDSFLEKMNHKTLEEKNAS